MHLFAEGSVEGQILVMVSFACVRAFGADLHSLGRLQPLRQLLHLSVSPVLAGSDRLFMG